jgi:hypothetical protein
MSPRRTAAVLTAAILAATALPYLYARLSTPVDLVYTGLMFDVPDHAQYWSWVTASRDALFISNTMTPEANPAIFANPTMWGLAQAQVAFGLSFPVLFQWWRTLAIILLVPALMAFIGIMMPERDRRPAGIVIALFGSGFGWMLILAKKITAAADVPWPLDLYTVEPNTFWSMLAYPHIALAHALILLTMIGAWQAYRGRGWAYWVMAGVAAASLSVSHAYDLITVYAVLGLFGLVTWVRDRRFPARLTAVGLVVAVCSGPAALYYQQLTSGDPLWRAVLSQYSNAGVWTPPHLHLIMLMGVPLLLGALGALRVAHWSEERLFAATWAATSVCLIYLPVVYQIKLLSGWQFPLAVLAAHAWHERTGPVLARRMSPRLAFAALALLVSFTNVYLFAWRFVDLRRHGAPYYLHHDQIAALDWLSEHARPFDVVIAQSEIGQFVPNYGRSRAYVAHWAMTNRFFERRANVERFFRSDGSEDWRRQLLSSEHVTLVLRSDWPEPPGAAYDPGESRSFELVFGSPHAQIYRFHPVEPARLARWTEGR